MSSSRQRQIAQDDAAVGLLVACEVGSGVVLASDSRAVFGSFVSDAVTKLVQIGDRPLVVGMHGSTHLGHWSLESVVLRQVAPLAARSPLSTESALEMTVGHASVAVDATTTVDEVLPRGYGWLAWGAADVVDRLVLGRDPRLGDVLARVGRWLEPDQADALEDVLVSLDRTPACDAMPIIDAEDLVRYLAESSTRWHRFFSTDQVAPIGGPVVTCVVDAARGEVRFARGGFPRSSSGCCWR